MNSVDVFSKLNFGDIDGLYDPDITNYFIDFGDYLDRIISKSVYYVIGRKGTGKSTLYRMIENEQQRRGILVSNLSFNDFPFEKFLKLSDDSFSKGGQYQSIWRNIILSEFAALIIKDESAKETHEYFEIKEYVEHHFGEDLKDLHKTVTSEARKLEGELYVKSIFGANRKKSRSSSKDYSNGVENITMINRRLEQKIGEHMRQDYTKRYLVQFDQLDDNYNIFQDQVTLLQAITSLFKVIYSINQNLRLLGAKPRVIAYLRSDIYSAMNGIDAESARWDQFKIHLNFAIVNKMDWKNPKLLRILNKRIVHNYPALKNDRNPFGSLMGGIKIDGNSAFHYIVHRSFHRPRDIVQFCIKIREEVAKHQQLDSRTIRNAEKEYSLWLLSEVENEIAPRFHNVGALYELLRVIGRGTISLSRFKTEYSKFKHAIQLDGDEVCRILYDFGIIMNVANNGDLYSIIRNDRSVFSRSMEIRLHQGFYQGIYASRFSKRN